MENNIGSNNSDKRSKDSNSDEEYSSFSWTSVSDSAVLKKIDKTVFIDHATRIPKKIQSFFQVNWAQPEEKRTINFWNQNRRYEATIKMTIPDFPRTQVSWRKDFSNLLRATYPKWYTFFHGGGMDSDDAPSLKFIKRPTTDEYDVEFIEESSPQVEPPVKIPLKPGDTLTNKELQSHFKCSPQGGMRRSHKTNSLVLVSDHTKSMYEDKWVEDVFYYTGMGLTGNQSLTFHQNKTLDESITNGINLHLFEVFEEGKYVYIGEVELAGKPFLDKQPDKNDAIRDVYVFPLKIKGTNHPPVLKKEILERKEELVRKKAHKLSLDELELRATYSQKESSKREVISSVYERNQLVSEFAKRKAKGICQLCNQPAPFHNLEGEPHLETHHIIPLANGGTDYIENVAALCPNCHRKMHILNLPADVTTLKNKTSLRIDTRNCGK